jgi:hypothetical protein
MQLTMLRSTTQRDIIWFLMLVHMSFCHILGTRILIVIIHNNFSSFKPKDSNLRFMCNNLRLRVNSFKYKALRLRPKDSRDNKLLA